MLPAAGREGERAGANRGADHGRGPRAGRHAEREDRRDVGRRRGVVHRDPDGPRRDEVPRRARRALAARLRVRPRRRASDDREARPRDARPRAHRGVLGGRVLRVWLGQDAREARRRCASARRRSSRSRSSAARSAASRRCSCPATRRSAALLVRALCASLFVQVVSSAGCSSRADAYDGRFRGDPHENRLASPCLLLALLVLRGLAQDPPGLGRDQGETTRAKAAIPPHAARRREDPRVVAAEISPDGKSVAVLTSVPRTASEPNGRSHSELSVVPFEGGRRKVLIPAPGNALGRPVVRRLAGDPVPVEARRRQGGARVERPRRGRRARPR